MPDTVEARRAYVASGGDKNREIPVYESDGITKIGVFAIGSGNEAKTSGGIRILVSGSSQRFG